MEVTKNKIIYSKIVGGTNSYIYYYIYLSSWNKEKNKTFIPPPLGKHIAHIYIDLTKVTQVLNLETILYASALESARIVIAHGNWLAYTTQMHRAVG